MPLSATSKAKGVGVAIDNVQFAPSVATLPRKIVIVGTFDPAKTAVVNDVPVQVYSPEDAGAQFGFGFMVHRMAKAAYRGSNGIETWIVPQDEDVAAVAADGSIDFAGTIITAAGTVYFYIAGDLYSIVGAVADDGDALATKLAAKITAERDAPVTAVVDGVTTSKVNITSKTKGPWGNSISLKLNLGFEESLPTGAVAAIVDMSSGAGLPDIDDALNGMGTGDGQNERYWTDGVQGYEKDATTLTKISTYNGISNDYIGNYSKTVCRPFRFCAGDVGAGSGGLTTLTTLGNNNKTDRTNCIIPVPGSASHPSEIAAVACGVMARIANDRPEQPYGDQILSGVWPGASADQWTKNYDDRDTAVKAGISTTVVENNAVYLSDVLTFYHPDAIPIESNAYRSYRNISLLQNFSNTVKTNFKATPYQGITIVADKKRVTRLLSKQKVRDIKDVINTCIAICKGAYASAWIFTDEFSIEKLTSGGYVALKTGANGFDIIIPIILSGQGDIYDTTVQVDTSIAVLTA